MFAFVCIGRISVILHFSFNIGPALIRMNNLRQLFYKTIYNRHVNRILRSLLFPFRSILPKAYLIPPSGNVRFSLQNNRSIVMHTNQTSFVTWNIAWKGYQNYEYVSIFESIAPKINFFLDVGSNTGLYSLILAGSNPNAKIWAFEPSPGPFKYLEKNIIENGFSDRIFAQKLALSSEDGTAQFVSAYSPKYPYLKEATLGGSGHLSGARSDTSELVFEVQTMTLDNFISEKQIEHIDLIKLDTEETEHLIISKGTNALKKFEPILICEVFSSEMALALNELLIPLGYQPYQFKNKSLIEMKKLEFSSDSIQDCFFVTPSKKSIIEQFIL